MNRSKTPTKLVPFDPARYLTDDEAVAEYLTTILEVDDPALLLTALNDVARARGMADVAEKAGLGRESLYKALAPGAKPRFDTILKVARALGLRLVVTNAAKPAARTSRSSRRAGVRARRRVVLMISAKRGNPDDGRL